MQVQVRIAVLLFIAMIIKSNESLAGNFELREGRFPFGKKQIVVTYPNPDNDPPGWSGGETNWEKWHFSSIYGPPIPSFTNGVSTIIISAEPTEAREIDEVLDQIRKEALDAKDRPYDPNSVKESEVIINGIMGKEIVYDWEMIPEVRIDKVRHIFFIKDGLLIGCYFRAISVRKAENEPVFDAVVRSIRVEDAPPKVGYAPIEWRSHYVSPDGLFEIDVPYRWETEEYQNDPDYTGVTFTRQEHIKRANEEWREGATIEVYVWKDAPAEWEVMERSKKYWEEDYRGFARDSEANLRVKEVEIAGVKGYEVRIWRPLYWDLHPERKVWVMIHFYKGGLKYRITYVAMGRNFNKDERVFKECLKSFRILK